LTAPALCAKRRRNMKTHLRTLLVLLGTATLASADWVIVQKSGFEGQEKEMSTKIKGDKARVDVTGEGTVIVGPEGMVMLMHPEKIVMKMDMETVQLTMDSAAQKAEQPAAAAAIKPVATGQKEKVGEWEAEIYTWEGQTGKGRFWVAKDFPKYTEINAANDKLGKVMGGAMSGLSPQATDFKGMVVKSEVSMMGKTLTTQLVSAKEQELDAKEFVVPAGYTEVQMPMLKSGVPLR